MIDPVKFLQQLQSSGIDFFTGVPDSLMKELLLCVDSSNVSHFIAANEGLAVGLAAGYHFATGKLPLVYLQNSGLGNIVNPVTSIADKEVYGVPMVLLIGWRGRPGTADEPQHIKMGRITVPLLDVLEIPHYILHGNPDSTASLIHEAASEAIRLSQPVAILVPAGVFNSSGMNEVPVSTGMVREKIIGAIYEKLDSEDCIVCTTGKTGREFDTCNREHAYRVKKYFLSVGGMGHANHIAAGISMFNKSGRTIMLDGDGALLMHMGAMPAIATWTDTSFIHILLNNEAHESVGGQPTLAKNMDMSAIAKACGYATVQKVTTPDEMEALVSDLGNIQGPAFIEIMIGTESRADLSRPVLTTTEAKSNLMKALRKA